MSISFYGSLIPSNLKETECKNKEVYQNNLKLLELFLTLASQIRDCVEKCKYKKFDALVGNFGCQITALEVQQLIGQETLKSEIDQLDSVVPEKQERLQQVIKRTTSAAIKSCIGLNLVEIIAKLGLDFEVSAKVSRLIRLRLLTIVNHNEIENGVEVPCTKYVNLQTVTKLSSKQIQFLVDSIQSEESTRAARTIIEQVESLNCERALLLKQVLNERHIELAKSKTKRIELLPNLHNTEACLRLFQGHLLVKNKLQDAKPIKVWLEIASNRILKKEEIFILEPERPIVVIEGYVRVEKRELKALIDHHGIIPIVNANCAKLQPQYSGWGMNDTFSLPEEALKDIEKYAALDEVLKAFEADHIYCASIKEERV